MIKKGSVTLGIIFLLSLVMLLFSGCQQPPPSVMMMKGGDTILLINTTLINNLTNNITQLITNNLSTNFTTINNLTQNFTTINNISGFFGTTPLIGGGLLTAASCTLTNTTVLGARLGMGAVVGTNLTNPVAPEPGVQMDAWIVANDIVTVRQCALLLITPAARTYAVKVYP